MGSVLVSNTHATEQDGLTWCQRQGQKKTELECLPPSASPAVVISLAV